MDVAAVDGVAACIDQMRQLHAVRRITRLGHVLVIAGRVIRKGLSAAVRFFEDEPTTERPAAPRPGTEARAMNATVSALTADDGGSTDGSCGGGGPRYMRPLLRSPTYTTRMLLSQGRLVAATRSGGVAQPPVPLRVRKVASSGHPSLRAGQVSLVHTTLTQPQQVAQRSAAPLMLTPESVRSSAQGAPCFRANSAWPLGQGTP